MSCTPNGCRSTQHPSHMENREKEGFSMGIRWLGGRGLHTTRSVIAHISLRVVLDVMVFVAA